MTTRSMPVPTPCSQPFWDGCAEGVLRLQRCANCGGFFFPPQPICIYCGSGNVSWQVASGRATLHTYLISHRAAPGFEDMGPYAIAIVELEEGPRLMTNLVGIENTPEWLELDMELEVTFVRHGDVVLPNFRPRAGEVNS